MKKTDESDGSAFGLSIAENRFLIMESDYKTKEDFNYLLDNFCPDKNERKGLRRRLRQFWDGGVEDKNGDILRDPNDDRNFMADFDDVIRDQWGEFLNNLDPLTAAAIRAWQPKSVYIPFTAMKKSYWLSWYAPGNDAYIIGDKGTGKTDFGVLIAEWARERGIAIVSAIPLMEGKSLKNYTECPLGSQLLRTLCHLKLQGKESLVLLDEGYLFTAGQTPLKPEVIKWTGLGRLLRKFAAAQVNISQSIADIHSDIKREATLRVKKLRKNRKDMARIDMTGTFEDKEINTKGYYKWIPPTGLPFNTDAIGTFKMDFDPDELYRYLAGMEKGRNQFQEALKWLDNRGVAFDMEQKMYLAKAMADQNITREIIATVLGVSTASVGRYLKSARERGQSFTTP